MIACGEPTYLCQYPLYGDSVHISGVVETSSDIRVQGRDMCCDYVISRSLFSAISQLIRTLIARDRISRFTQMNMKQNTV